MGKKIIRLTESDLVNIIKRVINEGEPFTFGDKLRSKLGTILGYSETSEDEKIMAQKILDKVESGEYTNVSRTDGYHGKGVNFTVSLEDGDYKVSARNQPQNLIYTLVITPDGNKMWISGRGFVKKQIGRAHV